MGQEVGPLYVASVFRVQGCKLAGCLFLLLVAQGPVAIPSLCCLVAVAHEVVQGQGAICGRQSVLAMPTPPQPWTPSLTSKAPSAPPQSRFSSGYTSHSQESSGELWWKAVPVMATTQEEGLTHPYSPNPQILRKKGDAAGPSFSAALAALPGMTLHR